MSIWALAWVGGLAALIIVARAMGYRSREVSYRLGIAVAGAIFLFGVISRFCDSFVAAGALVALALSAIIFMTRPAR